MNDHSYPKRRPPTTLTSVVGILVALAGHTALGAPDELREATGITAFPGAEGFGAYATGGRGGKVYHVTTLDDSDAPGTLRHAVEEADGPRTVVFDVSGTIHLQEDLSIRDPFITIAGQTAPGDGICLRDAPLKIYADDVIVRFLRVRLGDEGEDGDAISINSGNRIIVDHCSASWSLDEVLSASTKSANLSDVTVQWCFITNALNPKNHGFGSLIRGTGDARYSFHHNFYAHNRGRNPRPGNYDTNPHDEDPKGLLLDFRNNVIYNFGGNKAGYNSDKKSVTRLNYVGNTVIPGANSSSNYYSYAIGSTYNRAHFSDNLINGILPEDPWSAVDFRDWTPEEIATYKQEQPFDPGAISAEDPGSAAARVLEIGGASLPKRDPVDSLAVHSLRTRTGEFIKSQRDVGGWPELASTPTPVDSDGDGMPDAWESSNGFNPDDSSDGNGDKDGDGYTNVEEYLNGLVKLVSSGNYAQVIGHKPRLSDKPRVVVTSDGEIDDQCSMIRFMLYTNEWDVEGIITSSSQYHWQGHKWAGDDWIDPDLAAYAQVYPNLMKHDPSYPTPEYLRERTVLGNVKSEGDMEKATAGSDLIVKVLLDESDDRPVWLQAWGGMNTIARALKTIEEAHPERMAEAAAKCRFFAIWEQDTTYQDYIRPVWGKYEIPTIISDQFEAIAYRWKQIQPKEMQSYFDAAWMKENILENHGPLCSIYAAHEKTSERNNHEYYAGDFRSEGDSPAFLHTILTGLRNMESPDWGGWGGRYVRVRENTWLDPVPVEGYTHPKGRWYTGSAWGRQGTREGMASSTHPEYREYFKPIWRWTVAMQNDFAARADWCVKSYQDANHPPIVKLRHELDLKVEPGGTVKLSAKGTHDPDGDKLSYRWWQYEEADTYNDTIALKDAEKVDASFTVPENAMNGKTIHVVCEVTDAGSPPLTRYQRVVVEIEAPPATSESKPKEPRIIVTSDGEIDDQCSMIRFLLYANEWNIEGIITSSSQYHWQGHNWAGDDWIEPDLNAYEQVYANLLKHDSDYPTPDYLRERTLLGNVKAKGEMEEITAGSQHIAKVLLDETDDSPVWLQAWGGMNTIARALKTIEEDHPEKMAGVAAKCRFFFIWEQDNTYQKYIKPHWGKYNIPTIISDQFIAFFYTWDRTMPPREKKFYEAEWMNANILRDHGPLCSLYAAHDGEKKGYNVGDFRSEGDTPAFLFNIQNGLRSMESPDWGGWAGRYVRVRENTWLDPVSEPGYQYPEGRWYTRSAWGRQRLRKEIPNDQMLIDYLKPIWRWTEALQNDFASRADWCVQSYQDANHPPKVALAHSVDLKVSAGATINLSALGTNDPDKDELKYHWWQYGDADSYGGEIEIQDSTQREASFTVPKDAKMGQTIHVICEVTDSGAPPLTRYQRVVAEIQ